MNKIKVWPHLTIVAVVVALIAGLSVAFYLKNQQVVAAEALIPADRNRCDTAPASFEVRQSEAKGGFDDLGG